MPEIRSVPEPGQTLNTGDKEAVPRQAASVILLRGGAETLEVLLVKRTEKAKFMAGVWVFPGGGVDAHEGEGDAAHRRAAVRELVEEAGVTLADAAGSELVKFSQWITPAEVKIRFDTHFFLASMPAGQEVVIDGEECVDHGWFSPQAALDAHTGGQILLVFPTIKHLEQLAPFATADELLAYAAGRTVQPVQPRVVMTGETARVVLPGEPGYDD
ncbi:MutT/NUDIX hydrolase [Paraconexibacter sp. AEG42_29]|uniref:MutT/NUDIX hydrolase n=1 Tax=Paraconexibacter sp. AEG42_29 TaxID=2997339 RepID=A0AAU7ASC4_9ACTN